MADSVGIIGVGFTIKLRNLFLHLARSDLLRFPFVVTSACKVSPGSARPISQNERPALV